MPDAAAVVRPVRSWARSDPAPDDKNIALAKKEQEWAQVFLKQAQRYLAAAPAEGA